MTDLIGPLPNFPLTGGITVALRAFDVATGNLVTDCELVDIAFTIDTLDADDAAAPSAFVTPTFPYGTNL